MGATAGLPWPLVLNFYDETSGALTDPDTIQLDITYGSEIGFTSDVAGPFTYSGSSVPSSVQVYRISMGVYGFVWQIPAGALTGVYIANWSVGYSGDIFLGFENFPVAGVAAAVPAGDVGYWTGGITYPAAGLDIEFGTVDSNGIAWLWQRLEGWDSPDVQGAGVIPKSGDHGGYAAPQYYAPRVMTWTVMASAPTQALRDVARGLFQQAVPVSDLATLRYDEPVPKQALVRRSGKITETCLTLCDVQFSALLVAPDPRKYSAQGHTVTISTTPNTGIGFTAPFTSPLAVPPQPLAGSVAVVNAGTFETRPVITIAGPASSPTLQNVTTGQMVSWTGLTLVAGDLLVIDFAARQAFLNGAFRPADLSSSWWTLPPGTSTIQLGGTAGSGSSMTIAWSDAFI